MDRKAAIIVVLVALALAGVALLVTMEKKGPSPGARAPAWVERLSAQDVRAIRVRWRDGRVGEVALSPESRAWIVRVEGVAPWPAEAQRVRAALRLIEELAARPIHAGGAGEDEGATTVGVVVGEASDGAPAEHELRIGSGAIAGQAVVSFPGSGVRVMADDALRRIFEREALAAWRDARVIAREAFEPSRIALEMGVGEAQGRVALQRTRGRWGLATPVAAPADPKAIERLRAQIAGLSLSRVLDGASPGDPALGLDRPTAVATCETDLRALEGDAVRRWRLVERLTVGGNADVTGSGLFVMAEARYIDESGERPAWGPLIGVADRARLEAIAGSPAEYASRSSLDAPPADVVELALEPARAWDADGPRAGGASRQESRRFRRGIDGWTGEGAALSESDRARLDSLVSLLGERRADAVALSLDRLLAPGVEARPLVLVRAGSESVVVGLAGDATGEVVVVLAGACVRAYHWAEAGQIVRWAAALSPPEG